MASQLVRPYSEVDVTLFQGSPLSEQYTVPGVNWEGAYESQVRVSQSEESELLASLTVSAVSSGGNTVFTLGLSKVLSDSIGPGRYYWDARHSDGTVRLTGNFNIKPTVTP